ncbi:MAG: phage major capsid protein [Planctomycetota bacterium]
MSQVADLQEKRQKLAAQLKEHGNKFSESGWTAEDEKNWETLNADYDKVKGEIDSLMRGDAISSRLAEIEEQSKLPAPVARNSRGTIPGRESTSSIGDIGSDGPSAGDEKTRALALKAWLRYQMDFDVSDAEEQAAKACGFSLHKKKLTFESANTESLGLLREKYSSVHPTMRKDRGRFFNAPLTTQTATTGGNLIPPETLMNELEINMLAFDGVSQVADLIVTSSGETLGWPTVDDTGNTGVQVGENVNVDNSGAGGPTPNFGKTQWEAYKLSSQAVLVPYELLEDSAFNLPAVLGQLLGERIGRFRNQRYTLGTGSGQAQGIVTGSTLGVTAASATAFTADEIINLQHSVDPAYRAGAGFMMHDLIVSGVRKLKDSDGQYLWQSGLQAGTPDTLLGATLTVNQAMASAVATSNITMLYGDFSKYKIRRVNGFRMYRLEERYRDNDQDGFIMFVREDGGVLNAGTPPIKYLQQA